MDIEIDVEYYNPIDVVLNIGDQKLGGLHQNLPHKDVIPLLKGGRAFVMQMKDGERVIGRVEKRFEFITNARTLHLHLKGDTLHSTHAHTIFQDILKESYNEGKQLNS